jgi:hypothetical protein
MNCACGNEIKYCNETRCEDCFVNAQVKEIPACHKPLWKPGDGRVTRAPRKPRKIRLWSHAEMN